MLTIVDDQKQLPRPQCRCQRVQGTGRGAQIHTQDLANDRRYELRVIERGELGKPYAVRIALEQAAAGLDHKPGLTDAARSGEGHQAMTAQPRLDLREIGFASDQAGQLLGEIVARRAELGRRRRASIGGFGRFGLLAARALNRRHKAIAASSDGEKVALAVPGCGQHLAHGGNMNLDVVFFHHDAGPDFGHELVLGYQLPVAADQRQQNFEGALAERDRDTVGQQLAPPHQQAEWSEHEGFAHRSYSDDGAAGSTNRSVSRLRPSRRS